MGVREVNRARMARVIQTAAVDLVEEQGFNATTVGQIAARVGISERTVYRYYSSKVDALMPGHLDLRSALADLPLTDRTTTRITDSLLEACRQTFIAEVERNEFRRIARLLVQEPVLLHEAELLDRRLVEDITAVLSGDDDRPHLRAVLMAETVTVAWRVAWQTLARAELSGHHRDPVELFDETVTELRSLFTH